ncbi:uncharacterized protein [Brachionichthys hirsutus]|uniref:uncharacterized protein n=1 Tax=Brachionichthys hirsutus TaxID=412623 RepID=UPI00360519C8
MSPPPLISTSRSLLTFRSSSCSSVLPRLLSAHRSEVRRLLRGALASLGHRLDSLERGIGARKRRTRQREEKGGSGCSPGEIAVASVIAGDSPAPPHRSSSLSQSRGGGRRGDAEEGDGCGDKRRRKDHRGREMTGNGDEDGDESAGGFVGRMEVSFKGGAEEDDAPITLHSFNRKKPRRGERGGSGQSEAAVSAVRVNGFRAPLLLRGMPCTFCSQSGSLSISSGQWQFSDFTTPLACSSNRRAFYLFLSTASCSRAPMLRFSAVAMETVFESARGVTCLSPLMPLKDWTAPPGLNNDHCYVRTPTPSPASPTRRLQKQRKRKASLRQCNGSVPRGDESDVDVMLVERLGALEDFLIQRGLDV